MSNPIIRNLGSINHTNTFRYTENQLQPGTRYYIRAFAENTEGKIYSNVVQVITRQFPEVTINSQPTSKTHSSIRVGGAITVLGSPNPTEYGFVWSTGSNPTVTSNVGKYNFGLTSSTRTFTRNITGLMSYTTYYIRSYIINTTGTHYSPTQLITTTDGIAPIMDSTTVISATPTSILLRSRIIDTGNLTSTEHGFILSERQDWQNPITVNRGARSATTNFTYNAEGLKENTLYYIKSFAINEKGTGEGATQSFTTYQLPQVTTLEPSTITHNSCSIQGNLTRLGHPNPTQRGHVWSTQKDPTIALATKTTLGAASSTGVFVSSVTSLQPWTTYYIRSYATNAAGTVYGNEHTFKTRGVKPTLGSPSHANITTTGVELTSRITNLGVPEVTAHGFRLSKDAGLSTVVAHGNLGPTDSTSNFTHTFNDLEQNTVYYYLSYAVNVEGEQVSAIQNFRTHQHGMVETRNIITITPTSCRIAGEITLMGFPYPQQHGHVYSSTPVPTITDSVVNQGSANSLRSFESTIAGLTPHTKYYVRAFIQNQNGPVYGTETSFTTYALSEFAITEVSSVNATSARVTSEITYLGHGTPSQHGFVWAKTTSPTVNNFKSEQGPRNSTETFFFNISDLDENTMYYVRAYSINEAGTAYGPQTSFRTYQLPQVSMPQISNVNELIAAATADITRLGYPTPSEHGFEYSVNQDFSLPLFRTRKGPIDSAKSFGSALIDIQPNTVYYVRAYATNPLGTHIGDAVSFETLGPPSVSLIRLLHRQPTYVTLEAKVDYLGNPHPVDHGFVWGLTNNPSLEDNIGQARFNNTSSTEPFTHLLENLDPQTTYYVRTFAVNQVATVYGSQRIIDPLMPFIFSFNKGTEYNFKFSPYQGDVFLEANFSYKNIGRLQADIINVHESEKESYYEILDLLESADREDVEVSEVGTLHFTKKPRLKSIIPQTLYRLKSNITRKTHALIRLEEAELTTELIELYSLQETEKSFDAEITLPLSRSTRKLVGGFKNKDTLFRASRNVKHKAFDFKYSVLFEADRDQIGFIVDDLAISDKLDNDVYLLPLLSNSKRLSNTKATTSHLKFYLGKLKNRISRMKNIKFCNAKKKDNTMNLLFYNLKIPTGRITTSRTCYTLIDLLPTIFLERETQILDDLLELEKDFMDAVIFYPEALKLAKTNAKTGDTLIDLLPFMTLEKETQILEDLLALEKDVVDAVIFYPEALKLAKRLIYSSLFHSNPISRAKRLNLLTSRNLKDDLIEVFIERESVLLEELASFEQEAKEITALESLFTGYIPRRQAFDNFPGLILLKGKTITGRKETGLFEFEAEKYFSSLVGLSSLKSKLITGKTDHGLIESEIDRYFTSLIGLSSIKSKLITGKIESGLIESETDRHVTNLIEVSSLLRAIRKEYEGKAVRNSMLLSKRKKYDSIELSSILESEMDKEFEFLEILDDADKILLADENELLRIAKAKRPDKLATELSDLEESEFYYEATITHTFNALYDIKNWLTVFKKDNTGLLVHMNKEDAFFFISTQLEEHFLDRIRQNSSRHDYLSGLRMVDQIMESIEEDNSIDATKMLIQEIEKYHSDLYKLNVQGKKKLWLRL